MTLPYLFYEDAAKAIDCLVEVFGFREESAVRDEKGYVWTAKVDTGDGLVMIGPGMEGFGTRPIRDHDWATHRIYVEVQDVDAHYQRSRAGGASIRSEPAEHFSGSRLYVASDVGGHQWIFTSPSGSS